MPLNMNVLMGQLDTTCFSTEQARANAFAQALTVQFPLTASAFNYGISSPNVDQQALPWYRLNSDGTPDGWYSFINGSWIRPHSTPSGSPMSFFFEGSLSSLAIYDGGEGNYTVNTDGTIIPTIAISSTTGPMWQVDTFLQGRFPLGVSNTSIAAQQKDAYGNIINNFVQGAQGGEIQHTLIKIELAPHTHTLGVANNGSSGVSNVDGGPGSGGPAAYVANTNGTRVIQNGITSDITGGDTINNVNNVPIGHNNMPPYGIGYWVQRSSRVFYRI
jgi:hypothetical protein